MKLLKHYPLSLLCLVTVLILSLMPVPETPLAEIRFIDKWTHIVMYLGQGGIIWLEYLRQLGLRFNPKPYGLRLDAINHRGIICQAVVFPTILGGVLEILQEYCTNHMRSGDVIDFLADAFGALLAWLIVHLFLKAYK